MKTIYELERDHILSALEEFKGNKTRTAAALGISVRTIDNKLEQYGIRIEARICVESDLTSNQEKRPMSVQERQEVQKVSPELNSARAAFAFKYLRG